jgi:hypothetical protein
MDCARLCTILIDRGNVFGELVVRSVRFSVSFTVGSAVDQKHDLCHRHGLGQERYGTGCSYCSLESVAKATSIKYPTPLRDRLTSVTSGVIIRLNPALKYRVRIFLLERTDTRGICTKCEAIPSLRFQLIPTPSLLRICFHDPSE